MNIAIIGGSGFVGSKLISILKNQNLYDLLNFDKNQSAKHSNITCIGDVRNSEQLKKILKNQDVIILLAAEHKDDIWPVSLYYDVNVEGMKNVLKAMDDNNIKNIIFTSSVAIYGLNKDNPDEESPVDPFNHYGKSKWQAEQILKEWYRNDQEGKSATVIRPTVIFGEDNRGNVYNLLHQIASSKFLMVGKGKNRKSMAYVGNVAFFIKYCIENKEKGYHVYNYVDKPDLNMNELIREVETCLGKKLPPISIPYWLGLIGGYIFDMLSFITPKNIPISSVRVKKFCATTQFDGTKLHKTFTPPYSIHEALQRTIQYEFLKKNE